MRITAISRVGEFDRRPRGFAGQNENRNAMAAGGQRNKVRNHRSRVTIGTERWYRLEPDRPRTSHCAVAVVFPSNSATRWHSRELRLHQRSEGAGQNHHYCHDGNTTPHE